MASTSRFTTAPNDRTDRPAGNLGQDAGELKEKAQETAGQLGQKAQEIAGNVREQTEKFASTAAHKTEDALSTVGDKMSSLAGNIRERAPREGVLGSAASSVAGGLESGGRYLQQHRLSDMADDLSSLVRRNPMQSLVAFFGIGFLVGMAWRR